ncbi:MAG TPA: response regulator [Polyangiaceae bacterium]|jgi:two-component system response regulator MprA|nr:response regulator [Polyangiaceae bacterium]
MSADSSDFVVLLVDDELRTTRRLAEMLHEDGLTVEIARDGVAAISRLAQSPLPDALVTELTTSHANGIAISQFARSRQPGLPVFVVTGYPNLFEPDAFGAPPAMLFTKPVDYASLKEALLAAWNEKRAKDQEEAIRPRRLGCSD